MGVNHQYIFNKKNQPSGTQATLLDVHKKQRPITSVSSCSVVRGKQRTFQIAFREKNGIISREYEADTKMECAEIVAKINYLIKLNPDITTS